MLGRDFLESGPGVADERDLQEHFGRLQKHLLRNETFSTATVSGKADEAMVFGFEIYFRFAGEDEDVALVEYFDFFGELLDLVEHDVKSEDILFALGAAKGY